MEGRKTMKMNMKRLGAALLSGAMLATMLTGCGDGGSKGGR